MPLRSGPFPLQSAAGHQLLLQHTMDGQSAGVFVTVHAHRDTPSPATSGARSACWRLVLQQTDVLHVVSDCFSQRPMLPSTAEVHHF